MKTIDIRTTSQDKPTRIIFADDDYASVHSLEQTSTDLNFIVGEDQYDEDCFNINKKDVPMLLKAIQKAVELGWLPDMAPKKKAAPKAAKAAAKPAAKAAKKK